MSGALVIALIIWIWPATDLRNCQA